MKHSLLLASMLLLLASCQKDDAPTSTPIVPAQRTVIVYMSGENDLTSLASEDISEMVRGRRQVTSDAHLVVFVDKATSAEKPFIARVTGDTQHPLDTLYKYSADFYASDAARMTDVLRRATTLCPATEDYGLVLWGHATGWIIDNDSIAAHRAYGRDTGSDIASATGGKWLNIPSMRQALEDVGIHWKFIFCDCCNMQCAEVAYELRRLTDYLIASPAEITGVGAPYDTMVKDFFITDDVEMGIRMCADYNAQFDYVGGHLPISVVKTHSGATDNLQALADATRKVLPDVARYLATAEQPTQGIIYYYAHDHHQDNEKVHYDMLGMVRAALAEQPEAYAEWEQAFNAAVIYAEYSERWHANTINFNDFTVTADNCGVMSMFFPMEKYRSTSSHRYNDDIRRIAWYYAVGWPEVGW